MIEYLIHGGYGDNKDERESHSTHLNKLVSEGWVAIGITSAFVSGNNKVFNTVLLQREKPDYSTPKSDKIPVEI